MCNRSSRKSLIIYVSANTAAMMSMLCSICWVTWPTIPSKRWTPWINSGLRVRPPNKPSSTPYRMQFSSNEANVTTETKMCPIRREISPSHSTSSNGLKSALLKTTRELNCLTHSDVPPTRTLLVTPKTTEKQLNW